LPEDTSKSTNKTPFRCEKYAQDIITPPTIMLFSTQIGLNITKIHLFLGPEGGGYLPVIFWRKKYEKTGRQKRGQCD
jgi:hypothetical protein